MNKTQSIATTAEGVNLPAPSAPPSRQRLVKKDEMAEMLGIKPGTLVKMAQARKIPHYKLGYRTLLFDPAEVMAWIKRKHVPANPFSINKKRRLV